MKAVGQLDVKVTSLTWITLNRMVAIVKIGKPDTETRLQTPLARNNAEADYHHVSVGPRVTEMGTCEGSDYRSSHAHTARNRARNHIRLESN